MPAADQRYARACAIAQQVLELPPQARAAKLDDLCADDADLRAECEWLMQAAENEDDDDALEAGVAEATRRLADDLRIDGAAPGSYRLIRRIGEGGMGVVWLAERHAGGIVQRVALKRLIGSSPAQRDRFQEEQRILAALNHPNIAHLIDVGSDAVDTPFLAMEYVEGVRIDRWCDARGLDLRGRIRLFLKVCAAVSHAHEHLVIHRDLKPANILVAADGEPKLLDFGIARLLDSDAATHATRAMTLAYASPEQIEGAPLGTATDVYSLGVMLYELVAGVRPFDHLASDHARSNAIVSGEVTPPSRRRPMPSTSTEARRLQPSRRVPADVDAIVLKALRREPEQRYASVAEFGDDLRRHLAARPVLARHGQWGYRARRFLWRNRWPLAAAVLIAALSAGFTWRTVLAEREARQQAETSDRVASFLESIFAASDSNLSDKATHDLTAREVLAAGTDRINRELQSEPRIRARLLEAVGNAYRHMNENVTAAPLLRKAADLNLSPDVDDPAAAERCLEALANTLANGSFPSAEVERTARDSLALAQRLYAAGSQPVANAWMVLSLALNRSGNYRAASEAARTSLALNERLAPAEDNRLGAALNNLCLIEGNLGHFAAALAACKRRLDLDGTSMTLGPWFSFRAQAAIRLRTGDIEGALANYRTMLEITRHYEGETGPFTSDTRTQLAMALDDAGRHDEALAELERARATIDAANDEADKEGIGRSFGKHYATTGQFARALPLLRHGLVDVQHRFDAADPRVLGMQTDLATALLDSGVADAEVRRLLEDALEGWAGKDDPGTYHPDRARIALARWAARNGDPKAESLLATLAATPEPSFAVRAEIPAVQAEISRHAGRMEEAAEHARRWRDLLAGSLGAGHPLTLRAGLRYAADLRAAGGHEDEATAIEREARQELTRKLPAGSVFLDAAHEGASD